MDSNSGETRGHTLHLLPLVADLTEVELKTTFSNSFIMYVLVVWAVLFWHKGSVRGKRKEEKKERKPKRTGLFRTNLRGCRQRGLQLPTKNKA